MQMHKKIIGLLVVVFFLATPFFTINFVCVLSIEVTKGEYDDPNLYPKMWATVYGNYTTTEEIARKLIRSGKQPITIKGSTATFAFGIEIGSKDLVILSLDDIADMGIDCRDDAYGHEEVKIGSQSFLKSRSAIFDNDTNVDHDDGETFFWDDQTFDSDAYQYLLIEDASTDATTNGKVVCGCATSGNITVFDGVLVGQGGGDIWFRLDQHCSHENIVNVSVAHMSYTGISAFSLSGVSQWIDTRYMDVYLSETEYTATIAAGGVFKEYGANWHLGQGPQFEQNSLDAITKEDLLACRSPYWEAKSYIRVSGWLDEDHLEDDILNAVADWEGIDVDAISTYAVGNLIAYWKQTNEDVMDNFNVKISEYASQTSDAQTFVNMVAADTMPHSSFLIGIDNDIFESSPAGKYDDNDGKLSAKSFWEDLKKGANKVFDTTVAGIAAIGRGAGQVAQWGMDVANNIINTGTSTVKGVVDTTGKISENLVGAVATKGGALNPLGFFQKFKIIPILIILGIALIVVVVVWGIIRLANSRLAENVNPGDFL